MLRPCWRPRKINRPCSRSRLQARAVILQSSLTRLKAGQEINGFPAVTAVTRMVERGQEILIWLAWIGKDGLVYQVLGATTRPRWSEHRPSFGAAAASFRRPSEDELSQVQENRLRLVEARKGETPHDIAQRSHSAWSAAKMAVANALTSKEKLQGGESIKVSKRERYQP